MIVNKLSCSANNWCRLANNALKSGSDALFAHLSADDRQLTVYALPLDNNRDLIRTYW